MQKGQLARLPAAEGRRTERRMVNLAASLREPGATVDDIEVQNLSVDGFMAQTDMALEVGGTVWLKMPGLEAQKSQVVWIDAGKAGFQFAAPLHPATLEQVVSSQRPTVPRGHFGAPRFAR